MKIWLLERGSRCDYDEYDSFVVTSIDEETARQYQPDWGGFGTIANKYSNCIGSDWVHPDAVTVTYIGETELEEGIIICSSFNAG